MCEIGRWVGDVVYQDRYGREWTGPVALTTANQEKADYDACLQRERQAERAEYSERMQALADRPLANDGPLEQPSTLDVIAGYDYIISKDRLHFRAWNRRDPNWVPADWSEISKTARRVAVVQDTMCRALYRRRSGSSVVIWTIPLAHADLSKKERHKLERTKSGDGEPGAAAERSEMGLFTEDRKKWFDKSKRQWVLVWPRLRLLGVVEKNLWRIVYRDVTPDGQTVSIVSNPHNWEHLTKGEQESFNRNPLDMTAFQRPT